MPITREVVERVDVLTRTGLTITAAAKSLSLSFNGVKSAAQRYGIKLTRMTLVDRVLARADEIRTSDRTQKWWAKELDTTQPAIGLAFKKAGVQTLRGQQRSNTACPILPEKKLPQSIAIRPGWYSISLDLVIECPATTVQGKPWSSQVRNGVRIHSRSSGSCFANGIPGRTPACTNR